MSNDNHYHLGPHFHINPFLNDNLYRLYKYYEDFEEKESWENAAEDREGINENGLPKLDVTDFDFESNDYFGQEQKFLKRLALHKKKYDEKSYLYKKYKTDKEQNADPAYEYDRLYNRIKENDKKRRERREKRKKEQEEFKKQEAEKKRIIEEDDYPAAIKLPNEQEVEQAKQEKEAQEQEIKNNIDNTFEDLEVVNVDTDADSIPFFKEGLPPPPFRWVLNAQSMSGKTTLIINLLSAKMYGDYFPEFRLYSKSVGNDPKWDLLSTKQKQWACDKFDDAEVQQIWDEQKAKVKRDGGKTKENSILLIFDDMITSLYNRNGKPRVVQKMFMRGRHANISVIVTSQQYMLIPSTVRINPSALVIFEIFNVKEQENLYNEHGGIFSRKEWKALTKHVWSHPFSFLFIDYKQVLAKRFKRNFQYILQIANGEGKNENEF
jgi:hypothetical protein